MLNGSELLTVSGGTYTTDGNISSTPGLICNQEQGFPLAVSTRTANILRYIQIPYYLLCLIIASLLNAFVIYIIARYQKLQTTTFYLALQLVITDSVNVIIFFPVSASNAIADRFIFNGSCALLGFLITFLFVARNFLTLVLVVDRFCLIFLPFWYSRNRMQVVIPLSIAGWMLAFTVTVIPVILFIECYVFQRVSWNCLLGVSCSLNPVCTSYSFIVTTMANLTTFLALLLYSGLLYRARKLRNKIATISQSSESEEDRAIARRERKRERKANTTFLIMFIALVGVTLPSYIFFNLNTVVSRGMSTPPALTVAMVAFGNLYSLIFILDPIVMMRNEDVREVVEGMIAWLRGRGRESMIASLRGRGRDTPRSSPALEVQESIETASTDL